VVVLEVAGPLGAVVDDLDRAIQLALAERPRGVLCDLSATPEGVGPCTVQMLATAGRHVRSWPGTPVAVACADPRFRAALSTQSRGGHLIVTASIQQAVSALLSTPSPEIDCLRLSPGQTASRAAQDFIARSLLGAGLGPLIPAASLVVSELVDNSAIHAGSDIELSAQWNLGLLRLAVRDSSPDQAHRRYPQFVDGQGRGLSVVAALSRTFGVLPTADGGKVVWAVLNAARQDPPHPGAPTRHTREGLDPDATGTAEQPRDIYQGGTPWTPAQPSSNLPPEY